MLRNGLLPYKNVAKYLGALISDTGSIKTDVDLYIKEKRPDLTIKFSNFCKKHFLAPLSVKLQALHSCVLIYGAETWGNINNREVESLYRQGMCFIYPNQYQQRNCVFRIRTIPSYHSN